MSAWRLMRFLYFMLNNCHNRGLSGVCLRWLDNSFSCSCTYPYSISSSRPPVSSQWVRPEHVVMSPGKGPVGVFSRWHRHGTSGGGRTQTGAHHCLPLHWWSEAFPILFFSSAFVLLSILSTACFPSFFPCHSSPPTWIILNQFSSVFSHHH